jgi:hypothetical protein
MPPRSRDRRDAAFPPRAQQAAQPRSSQALSVAFSDGHTDSIEQRRLRDLASGGVHPEGAAAHQQRIENSPLIGSQRAVMQRLTGGASRKAFAAASSYVTSLPSGLKHGIERLSGVSMDSVNVRYNSDRPATFDALATTTGSTIELGPGQESSLPHEAWHAAQQRQGRVEATTQMNGVAVNDQPALEQEADIMGARAQHGDGETSHAVKDGASQTASNSSTPVVQRDPTEQTSSHSSDAEQQAEKERQALGTFLDQAATLVTTVDEVLALLQAREVDAKALASSLTKLSAAKIALGATAVGLGVTAIVLTAGAAAIPMALVATGFAVSGTSALVGVASAVKKSQLDELTTPETEQGSSSALLPSSAQTRAAMKSVTTSGAKAGLKEGTKEVLKKAGEGAAGAVVGGALGTAFGALGVVEGVQGMRQFGNFDPESITQAAWSQLSALSEGLGVLLYDFGQREFADEECQRLQLAIRLMLFNKKNEVDALLVKNHAPG